MDLYVKVRRAVMVDAMSGRAVARNFGISRKTVSKMVNHAVPPGYQRKEPALLAPTQILPRHRLLNGPTIGGCYPAPSNGFKVIALGHRKSADWVNLTSASTHKPNFWLFAELSPALYTFTTDLLPPIYSNTIVQSCTHPGSTKQNLVKVNGSFIVRGQLLLCL